jgi:hypothetical protein
MLLTTIKMMRISDAGSPAQPLRRNLRWAHGFSSRLRVSRDSATAGFRPPNHFDRPTSRTRAGGVARPTLSIAV